MNLKNEQGNLSLGIIMIGALVGLTTIMNQNKKVEQSINTAKVRKVSLESEELSLYGFTVVRQLFSNESGVAGLGLANAFDPASLSDITIKQLISTNSTKIKLVSNRNLTVLAPDLLAQETSQMNSIFETSSFSSLDKKLTPIDMQVVDFETYPSGYGVRNLIFESKVELVLNKQSKLYTSRARIPIPPPPVACQMTVQGQIVSGATITIKQSTVGQKLAINANCSGNPIAAYLDVNLAQVADAILPKVFAPIFSDYMVSAPGRYELTVRATRVDEVTSTSAPVVLFIEGPTIATTTNDYKKCLYKCACNWPAFAEPNLCSGSTDFVNPFHNLKTFGALPAITGNPLYDSASFKILEKWAYDAGAANDGETHGAKLQGLLYPSNGYGTKLACSKVGGGGNWLTWAFDPDNNCQEEFIGSRGNIGCLVEGSRVMIGPNTYKAIETLTREDRIWNPKLARYFSIKKLIHGPEAKDLYLIRLQGKSISMTFDHPVLTQNGYRQAADLSMDDQLFINNQFESLESITIQKSESAIEVWNMIIEDAHTWDEHVFFVEGVAVGDLWMQQEMSNK